VHIQVQIHGPVSLSDNVDCLVVNERHKSCPTVQGLLEKFVEKNRCNLIWMEPVGNINYPRFEEAVPKAKKKRSHGHAYYDYDDYY
jgi:hypothetical protein